MKYKQVKTEVINFEKEVKSKTYNCRKLTYYEKLALMDILTKQWFEIYLNLYELRNKQPLDNGKDKLYDKLNNIRDNIISINIKRR